VYVPNNKASKYLKQTLIELKGKIQKPKNTLGDFNLLSQQLIEKLSASI
jgi:hypothetical protein